MSGLTFLKFNRRRLGIPMLAMAAMTVLACAACDVQAAEYFVGVRGSDQQDGGTPATAFLSIQKGLDALAPGDTLTILPGEYHQSAHREDLGSAEAVTTIRAQIPRTVLLRGDRVAPAFAPVDGFRFVYAADVDGEVQGVLETDTPTNLTPSTTLADLEYSPGSWFHDEQRKKLYISSSDLQPADQVHYRVAMIPRHGLHLDRPQRVVVEGLAATGFQTKTQQPDYPGYYAVWGIMLSGAKHCVIRDCVAYLNAGGIAIHSARNDGGNNLIDGCTAFANGNVHCVEGGNICVFSSNHDVVQNCYFYGAQGNGTRHYGAGIRGPAITRYSIGWGNRSADYFLKGGKVPQFGLVENCISLGKLYSHNLRNSIVGTSNQYNTEPTGDNIRLASELADAAKWRDEFADPDNLHFHLQATSRFRGAGPDGADRGPFPYRANIFYVKTGGDDRADGLSIRNAWGTLDRALQTIGSGDTLYLEPGVYEAGGAISIAAGDKGPASIRGRGVAPVIIKTPVAMTDSADVSIHRIDFAGPVTVARSSSVTFRNCRFYGGKVSLQAKQVRGMRITHSEFLDFSEAALRADGCSDLFLSGNIFDNAGGAGLMIDASAAVLYADYNAYRNASTAWSVGGTAISLDVVRKSHEQYATVMTPAYQMTDGAPQLTNAGAFKSGGPVGGALGLHHEYRPAVLRVVGPFVHSMTATTANIEWWTSRPASCEIAWGPTPACENVTTLSTQEFGGFSLTGLEPGRSYHFAIRSVEPRIEGDQQRMTRVTPDAEPVSFTTPTEARTPVTYYVASDGDDQRSGLSRDQAWRTVAFAGAKVLAGDTVLIAGGTYTETVHVRSSGDEGLPITFKSMPGEKVVFDGNNRLMSIAFSVARKQHVRIDGLYFQDFGLKGWETIISLFDSSHVQVTRCFMNNRGKGYPSHFLYAAGGEDVLVANCVIANGTYGIYTTGTTGLRLENNVFLHNAITNGTIRAPGPQGAILTRNIIVDNTLFKTRVPLFEIGGGVAAYTFRDNCFFLRRPDDERLCLYFYGDGPGRLSVGAYEKQSGHGGNVFRDPLFEMTVGQTPKDREGKPIEFIPDWMFSQPGIDFPSLYATDAQLIERNIGLSPRAFADFHFNVSGK